LLLIPAIDMMDGKCVRLVQGRFDESTTFSDDPVQIAKRWESMGAKIIHLVDLNGSRYGYPKELETVKQIADAVNVPLQLGGGIRNFDTAQMAFDAGVSRVIIGTSAASDSELAKKLFGELGERAVLAVDAKDGYVAVKGWEELTGKAAVEFALEMQSYGAKRVIYTDISRDGMMQGTNIEAMKIMAESLDIPVIASGGVSSESDIEKLSKLEKSGIEGAILGKALYIRAIDLAEVITKWT
jgi:phosphoribosylformimino-5-aminoimidazole carboxamide ribotide isomerase